MKALCRALGIMAMLFTPIPSNKGKTGQGG